MKIIVNTVQSVMTTLFGVLNRDRIINVGKRERDARSNQLTKHSTALQIPTIWNSFLFHRHQELTVALGCLTY